VLQPVIQILLRWLPSPLRSWIYSSFPEWFLPTNIILKKQKDGWDEEFDTEKAAYEKLKCLQGLVIPICYGQAQYKGTRALVLSDIGGSCVAEPKGAVLREQDIRPLFDQALSALASQGISHDDMKLDNFHLVNHSGNKIIMIVDLERINQLPPQKDPTQMVQADVDFLMQAYRDHLECLKEDGLLPK
jgi:serine/threonine protein kinase